SPRPSPSPIPSLSVGEAPKLRLPAGVKPVKYSIDFTLRPEVAEQSGSEIIDVDVAAPAAALWLNAVDLKVESASFGVGGASQPAQVVRTAPGFIALAGAAPLPAGRARVHIKWRVQAPDGRATGLFRVREAGDWYLLSKSESIFARTFFPCFDEPQLKVPFEVSLTVPTALMARSNMPPAGETDAGEGMKTVRFAPTPPLPTYLFALAVGPFDVLDAGYRGKKQTHIELLVPRGRRVPAGFAAAASGALFEQLEKYFGMSYPYEKLDEIAAPQYPGA